jgi:HlyD family secretion protein
LTLVIFEPWSSMERKRMRRTILYIVLGVVLVAAVGGAFVLQRQQTAAQEEEARSAIVERGPLLVAVSASGSIQPETRVSLTFETSGEVAEVPVQVGDRVKAGDVLVRLETGELTLQVQQTEASVALAEAQLAQLREGARSEEVASAQANLRGLEAQLNAAIANRDQVVAGPTDAQIAAAETQLAAAELEHRVTLIAHDRTLEETKDGDRREQARYDLWAADQAVAAAQAQLDDLLAGADANAARAARANVAAVEAQRDAAQAQLDALLAGATEEQLTDVEAQVAQAEASLELAELALEKATLRAPFDGVVAAVSVSVGEMASAGLPAITLLDTSEFHMTVGVDELDVGRLGLGQVAQVSLDAIPEAELTGKVERIAPAATIAGGVVTYDVVVALEKTDVPIRADMTANATIVVEELSDVLKIPTWVVRVDKDTGQTYVNQREGEEIVRTDVALGIRYEGIAQVLSGLSEGDEAIWVEDSSFGFGPQ